MTPNQTDNVIAGYRKATDAQQQIIIDLKDEISILREQIESRDRHMNVCRGRTKCPADEVLAEWLKGFVRLDDPVVTGLVDSLKLHVQVLPDIVASGALSAYEARVKSIEPQWQNHGHLEIDHTYNNETTTMSPVRVKEVSRE